MAGLDLQKQYDSLLALLDELLKDESPLSQNNDWMIAIDDNLLQLKLWGKAIRANDGTLQKISFDKYFTLSVHRMLAEIRELVEIVSRKDELPTVMPGLRYVTLRSIHEGAFLSDIILTRWSQSVLMKH